MKCDVCEQEGLSWLRKLPLVFTFPMKCKHCNARYRMGQPSDVLPSSLKNMWEFLFGWFDIIIIILVLALLTWVVNTYSWTLAIILGLIIWAVIILLTPHKLNPKDPVNKIVQRIQEKKRQTKSPDTDPNP